MGDEKEDDAAKYGYEDPDSKYGYEDPDEAASIRNRPALRTARRSSMKQEGEQEYQHGDDEHPFSLLERSRYTYLENLNLSSDERLLTFVTHPRWKSHRHSGGTQKLCGYNQRTMTRFPKTTPRSSNM